MAAKTNYYGEILGSTERASTEATKAETVNTRDQDGVLHITINLLNVMPTREVQVAPKGTETISSHYWMNSLPFVKQTS
jgi:hypothetical protein